MISDFNIHDFLYLLIIALVSMGAMWYLTLWLISLRRKSSFLIFVWSCYGLFLLLGGLTSLNSVQKERLYWSKYFTEITKAYASIIENIGHHQIEFSYSRWSESLNCDDQIGNDFFPSDPPLHSTRTIDSPEDLLVELHENRNIAVRWKSVPEANAYEVQRTENLSDPNGWEQVYRGEDASFTDFFPAESSRGDINAFYYRVRAVHTTPEDDPLYLELCKFMIDGAERCNDIGSIYTIRDYDEDHIVFLVSPAMDMNGDGEIDPITERPAPIGEVFPKSQAVKIAFAKGIGTVNTIPIADDWGVWVGAVEPIFSPGGAIDALVAVDFKANIWTDNIWTAQLRFVSFLIFVLVLFFSGTILIARLQHTEDEQRDTTSKLRVAVDQLVDAKQNADVAARAKSHFLANMSHEIRTPMNAILGFADILGRRLLESCNEGQLEENKRTVRMIEQSGSDLLTIINDILDFSKVDADQVEIEWIPVEPRLILEDVRQLVLTRLEEKPDVLFQIEIDDEVPRHILSDPTRLRQILANLCVNAIKFSEKGTVLMQCRILRFANTTENRSRIRQDYGEEVSLDLFEEKQEIVLLQFLVQDEGIGMSSQQIDRLFQPFMQADSSLTRRFGGTGLGLSISKRLAKLLGGDISVQSREGKGSTFQVTIAPKIITVQPQAAHSGIILLSNEEKPLEGRNILLVEDGKVNQIVISTQLKDAGAYVQIAENGQLALDAVDARDTEFDLILMDMQMPVMDGYEATRRLRKQGFSKPIIAVTAHALSGDCEKTMEMGCDAYISKPIERGKLIDMILRFDQSSFSVQ